MARYYCEFLGTFALVMAGTGAIVSNDVTGAVSHVGIALTFGLVVLATIYAVGDVSGAHINPAVTIGFCVARRLSFAELAPYVFSQFLGAIAASAVLKGLFPSHETLGSTVPSGTLAQSFAVEVILTWYLMFVILCVSSGSKEKGIMAGVAVGAVVGLSALWAGPICGASMNPARSIGPALISQNWTAQWIYVIAPIVGAVLAVASYQLTRIGADSKPSSQRAES